ncbi:Fe-S cluster assembly sulfur transfer protein SufU [Alicyclobacillus sp.]|uniref:Fe-S cluster assembly sulfur transfer protein SufU n=1 Tax=Alicyclobacillus sp. TaxID=61169 RepID=UPI0025C2D51D|nr:SUF system NifU family Fe-S cluster assembly protein [Alicyclobacillus sp.]MCL6515710.1 SUF system NifU family Fe-S cluster assembly protein [Alicyclobacillus sp.]
MQLDDLYRQVIMDHYQRPRNLGELEHGTVTVDLRNPSCGDEIRLQLLVEDGVVKDVRFRGAGCSISMSSASMMTEAIKGKPVDEALRLSHTFRAMIRGEDVDTEPLGDLEALQGVSKFPARVKCATLAWQALERAVGSDEDASR